MKAFEVLTDTLVRLGLDITYSKHNNSQVHYMFRVPNSKVWAYIGDCIVSETNRRGEWDVHICMRLMNENGKSGYRWNMIIQKGEKPLEDALFNISTIIELAGRSNITEKPKSNGKPKQKRPNHEEIKNVAGSNSHIRQEGNETVIPLIGVTANRNMPQAPMFGADSRSGLKSKLSCKGAHLIGEDK